MTLLNLILCALASLTVVPQDPGEPPLVVVEFHGQLSEGMVALTLRSLREAQDLSARAVIFEIDTPGGQVTLMDRILTAIESAEGVTTVAYVVQHAASAGALIAIACDRLYMKPGSTIGSARPIWGSPLPIPIPQVQEETNRKRTEQEEKVISLIRSHFRSKAQATGRNEAIAEAMVDQEIAVYEIQVDGIRRIVTDREYEERLTLARPGNVQKVRTICERGTLLNMTANEALDYDFIDGLANNRSDVLSFLNAEQAPVVELSMSWSEKLVEFIQSYGWLLLIGGLLAVFVELKVPGFGVPGILGAGMLGLLFFGKYLAGLAEITEILLIVLGFILVAVEVFVLPGTFLPGVLGVLSIVAGIVLSFQSIPLPSSTSPWGAEEWWNNTTDIALSFVGGVFAMYLLAQFLPHIPILNRVALRGSFSRVELRGTGIDDVHRDWLPAVGALGRALTALRPAGKIEIENRHLDAVAEGQFVESGAPVEILRLEGNRIVVGPPTVPLPSAPSPPGTPNV